MREVINATHYLENVRYIGRQLHLLVVDGAKRIHRLSYIIEIIIICA